MNDIYLTIADGFEKLANGYRALAAQSQSTAEVDEDTSKPTKPITDADIRAVLGPKMEKQKTEIKALLLKYGNGTLKAVAPADYEALLAEAREL